MAGRYRFTFPGNDMFRLRDIFGLLASDDCIVCGNTLAAEERDICMRCVAHLLVANFPFASDSRLRPRIDRHLPVDKIGAMTVYTPDSDIGRLIKAGKYDNRPDIFEALGRVWASSLATSADLGDIDAIQPVPMNAAKQMARGYNQATIVAQCISKATGLPMIDSIAARYGHRTQTRKSRAERIEGVRDFFHQRPGSPAAGRHVLIVDDIITTGSTISAAARVVAAQGARAISLTALAATIET